jgi:2',3'-cyclic-nucleotide 2'-phosphodiesterase (5'-nucleotidase family)
MRNSVLKIVRPVGYGLSLLLAGWSATSVSFAQRPAAAPSPSAATTAAPREIPARASETLIDSSIPDDQAVDQMLSAYNPKVRALDNVIGKLKGELKKGGMGAGSLGNFVTDGMRLQASVKLGRPVDLAIMNSGGLRRNTIGEGELRARDIFELLPFENALVTLDLSGAQLLKLLTMVVSAREPQSGARLTYITKADKKSELESARLLDDKSQEREIDPKATYTIVTIDYLVNVGGDRYGILSEGKNTKPVGITLRDAIIEYVKTETASAREIKPTLDERFVLDRANSVITEDSPAK